MKKFETVGRQQAINRIAKYQRVQLKLENITFASNLIEKLIF